MFASHKILESSMIEFRNVHECLLVNVSYLLLILVPLTNKTILQTFFKHKFSCNFIKSNSLYSNLFIFLLPEDY